LLDDDLRTLCACGASVLVTLLEETEMARIDLADLFARAERAGLETLRDRRRLLPRCAGSGERTPAAIDAAREARPGATAPGQLDSVKAFGGACRSRARAVNEEERP
jgi:hypothetical protein